MLSSITENSIYDFVGKEADKTALTPKMSAKNNGCSFLALDTKSIYIFDGDTLTWVLLASLSS